MPVGRLGTTTFEAQAPARGEGSAGRATEAGPGPVGHGAIRLRGREGIPDPAREGVAAAAPAGPEPAGHGTTRLLTPPPPGVHTDPVTAAAVADILAAVAGSGAA